MKLLLFFYLIFLFSCDTPTQSASKVEEAKGSNYYIEDMSPVLSSVSFYKLTVDSVSYIVVGSSHGIAIMKHTK